jgi:hypothetical protein
VAETGFGNSESTAAAGDRLGDVALRAAQKHFAAGFGFLSGHYMGKHWLASFAALALRPDPAFDSV